MIIPSIDLVEGNAVQLVHGKKLKINAGNPTPIAKHFALSGKLAIIDIDAAKYGKSTHRQQIIDLIKLVHNEHANCKVHIGGGIRDFQTAVDWLDNGADRIIIGTAAKVDLLKKLPRQRVIVALDAIGGKVVVNGWQVKTGELIFDKIRELAPYVYGFLITFVEVEGTMKGFDFSKVKQLVEFAAKISPDIKIIYAGGITTCEQVRQCDEIGVDVQVGMALYSGVLKLADSILAPVKVSENGLIPTVVVDENGECLGFVYSNYESVREAVKTGKGVYYSRKRGLWIKGNESGNTQELLRIDVDCDRDALRFIVRQHGSGFCHLKDRSSCFGDDEMGISKLFKLVETRLQQAPKESYTKKLLCNSALLDSKIIEEANELVGASSPQEVIHEAADLMYFTIVRCVSKGISLKDLQNELLSRSLRVTRRPGYAKKFSSKNDPKIRLGIPKGRLEKNIVKLLHSIGCKVKILHDRNYQPQVSNLDGFEVKLLKPQNIVRMLHAGMLDLGFSGADLYKELTIFEQNSVSEVLDTGLDPVSVVACCSKASPVSLKDDQLCIASEYLNLTKQWIKEQGIKNCKLWYSFGGTEGFPPNQADVCIVNCATKTTIERNNLQILSKIMDSSTRLYVRNEALNDVQKREKINVFIKQITNALKQKPKSRFLMSNKLLFFKSKL